MKSNTLRVCLESLAAIGFWIWGHWFADSNLQPELYGMAIGTIVALLIELLSAVYENWQFLSIYLNTMSPFTHSELRISIAYLFRIEQGGKYLLVKSERIPNTFQPVGGVYKYFSPEAKSALDRLTIVPDHKIPNDEVSEFDLRVKMRERSKLRGFLNWFFNQEGRECDPWREFYEELVNTGILPSKDFPYIHAQLVAQHFEPIHFDEHFGIDTFKYVDIYEPKFVNTTQANLMKALVNFNDPRFLWATYEEIKTGRTQNGQAIAPHSIKIFHNKKIQN